MRVTPRTRYYIVIDHDRMRAVLRVNIWRRQRDIDARFAACSDPVQSGARRQRNISVNAFFCARSGLPRGSRAGIDGELNFTIRSIKSIEYIAHECAHAAMTLHSRIDLNNSDVWEESVADLIGLLVSLIQG